MPHIQQLCYQKRLDAHMGAMILDMDFLVYMAVFGVLCNFVDNLD